MMGFSCFPLVPCSYYAFDIPQKRFFTWYFILNRKIDFWMTISYKKPFLISVPVLCFQTTAKLILWPEMGLTYAISIVNLSFGDFLLKNIFWFSSQILNYWWSIIILRKFQKFWTGGTCWKSASKLSRLPYQFLPFLQPFLLWKKMKIFNF